jgi:hypothetical protein
LMEAFGSITPLFRILLSTAAPNAHHRAFEWVYQLFPSPCTVWIARALSFWHEDCLGRKSLLKWDMNRPSRFPIDRDERGSAVHEVQS